VLAHARLLREMTGAAPIRLIDEVLAHLDPARRLALHGELAELNAQAWMTGADPTLYREIESSADVVEQKSGTLTTSTRRYCVHPPLLRVSNIVRLLTRKKP